MTSNQQACATPCLAMAVGCGCRRRMTSVPDRRLRHGNSCPRGDGLSQDLSRSPPERPLISDEHGAHDRKRAGLENRCSGNPATEGSNPSPSAEAMNAGFCSLRHRGYLYASFPPSARHFPKPPQRVSAAQTRPHRRTMPAPRSERSHETAPPPQGATAVKPPARFRQAPS